MRRENTCLMYPARGGLIQPSNVPRLSNVRGSQQLSDQMSKPCLVAGRLLLVPPRRCADLPRSSSAHLMAWTTIHGLSLRGLPAQVKVSSHWRLHDGHGLNVIERYCSVTTTFSDNSYTRKRSHGGIILLTQLCMHTC